jgi:hypothetical protein
MSYAGDERRIASARGTSLRAVIVFALCWAAGATAQTCSWNPNNPNAVSFGAIDPTLRTTYTFTITINYKCTGSANATFLITGANDAGPGAYRLQNSTAPSQFMTYSLVLTDVPGTKLTLSGQLFPASYRDAYAGSYSDTLSVLILP